MNGTDLFTRLVYIGSAAGTVTSAMMYDNGFMSIEGKTAEGKPFSITMHIKEEEEKDA